MRQAATPPAGSTRPPKCPPCREYGRTGPGCGAEHIATLEQLAIASGLTVPLYTVTGWPTLDIPAREVIPVSGAGAVAMDTVLAVAIAFV
jgi:hypothetical protein